MYQVQVQSSTEAFCRSGCCLIFISTSYTARCFSSICFVSSPISLGLSRSQLPVYVDRRLLRNHCMSSLSKMLNYMLSGCLLTIFLESFSSFLEILSFVPMSPLACSRYTKFCFLIHLSTFSRSQSMQLKQHIQALGSPLRAEHHTNIKHLPSNFQNHDLKNAKPPPPPKKKKKNLHLPSENYVFGNRNKAHSGRDGSINEEDSGFKWGEKSSDSSYKSMYYHGEEYHLHDCVYCYLGRTVNYVGKIM